MYFKILWTDAQQKHASVFFNPGRFSRILHNLKLLKKLKSNFSLDDIHVDFLIEFEKRKRNKNNSIAPLVSTYVLRALRVNMDIAKNRHNKSGGLAV